MKKLLMIAIVAIFVTVACEKAGADNETTSAKVSISVTATSEVEQGGNCKITITADDAPESDVLVNIAVDNNNILELPVSAVIKKGEKTSVLESVTKASGEVKITISSLHAIVSVATATVNVKNEVNQLTATAPTLNYSTANGFVEAVVNFTLTKAVDFDIEIEAGYNFDNWDWVNNADGYPEGVSWSEYPIVFPKNQSEHSFHLIIQQGNAGTLPLILTSLKGSKAKDIKFTEYEFDFVITK